MVSTGLCSSGFHSPFHNANVEIGEYQQHQEPENAHCCSIADTFFDKTGAIDIDDDVIGGVARAAIRHGPDDGKLIETPDELQSGGNDDDAAHPWQGYMPEPIPDPRTIYSGSIDQVLGKGLQSGQQHQREERKFIPDSGIDGGDD